MHIQDEVGQGKTENLFMESLHVPQVALSGRIVYIIKRNMVKKIPTLKVSSTIHEWGRQTRKKTRKELGVSVHLSELHGCGRNLSCLSLHLYISFSMVDYLLKVKAKINHFEFFLSGI